MSQPKFSWDQFNNMPIVGIARNIAQHYMNKIADLYIISGLTTIEITLNSPGALSTINSLAQRHGTILNVGAGTVCTTGDVESAANAGASFIVTPITDASLIKRAKLFNLPVFAGAYTPTEIYTAWRLGASFVKVFPASTLGSQYIRELQGPMPQINLLPTGGINLTNCTSFLQAGAKGLGIGGSLFDKKTISDQNWTQLTETFKRYATAVKAELK